MILNKFGTEYGGWSRIPLESLNSHSVVYSFGAGEDICYEFLLSGLTNAEIHIFDPTPRAIEHFDFCKNLCKGYLEDVYNPRHGGGDRNYNSHIKNSKADLNKIFFHNYGIYDEDSSFDFYYPKNPEHVSLSIDNLNNTDDFISLNVKKIDSIFEDLDHRFIDVVKFNIEGAEVRALLHMLKNTTIRPTYISVKFELARDKKNKNESLINELDRCLQQEYDEIYSEPAKYNYTYKKREKKNKFVI